MASVTLNLCPSCRRQFSGEDAENVKLVEESFQCALCWGILDEDFISKVASQVEQELKKAPYDASSFVLALNLPTAQTLREVVIKKARPDAIGTLVGVPFKIRNIDAYIRKLSEASGMRPTLNSDLRLTINFVNDEFNDKDLAILLDVFPREFQCGRKRRVDDGPTTEFTKVRVDQVLSRIDPTIASKFELSSPTQWCSVSMDFERDAVFIAGRYCKFSRTLPQSPWSSEDRDAPKIPGNSVSEKICNVLKKYFDADDTTFVASGREDIDVRMLGTGRPFCVELKNCHKTKSLKKDTLSTTLQLLQAEINKEVDIQVYSLTKVTKEQMDSLNTDQEEKKKSYTAYCYSTLPLSEEKLKKLTSAVPVTLIQKTPVRVLKRRSLLDRPRTIYTAESILLDNHHFLLRIETQAGTYVKEFVHGDFGRTRPSVADLLEVQHGEVDILELDVEKVDLEWPPVN